MKARVGIIPLVLCVSIVITVLADAAANELSDLTFGKYYKPYEPNIEPNTPGYSLPLGLTDIINYDQVSSVLNLTNVQHLIKQNGFAVVEYDLGSVSKQYLDDIIVLYARLKTKGIPFFVTTDTILNLYRIQFNETLKEIEENWLISDITSLTEILLSDALIKYDQYDNDLKEAAKRNAAYLSVAGKLLDPNSQIPEFVANIVAGELAKIEVHEGFKPSDIFIYDEDYSQYVPRGHYTRSEQLKRYFKTMMWYGRMAFLLKSGHGGLISEYDARIQTMQAFLLANSLKNVRVGQRSGLDLWDRIYTVTAFYVGYSDNLTPHDYLWALDQAFGSDFALSDLTDPNNLFTLKTKLALLPSPRIYGGEGNIRFSGPITDESINEILYKTKGMCLMGQRFVPDSYMFQHMVFPEVGGYHGDSKSQPFTAGQDGMGGLSRVFVRGLDLMALLGSREALKILIDEGDTDFVRFWQRFGELKDEFDALSPMDWNTNLYWSRLYTLKALLNELPEGYPNFMRTEAWQKRKLHGALASWTQLRHDTILFIKQIHGFAGGAPPSYYAPPPGYIEPLPIFWGRLLSMNRMMSQVLDDLNLLSIYARRRSAKLDELLKRILDILSKQMINRQLSSKDCIFIENLPSTLDLAISGIGPKDLKTTLVADVQTHPVEGKVVEEATGKVDLIVVACPMPDGKAFLAAGPVLSYYEFKHPMRDRLTDEAWRELLDSPKKPARPKWYIPLMGTFSADLE